MGRAILFGRLAAKDLRRHLAEGVLLFMVIAAASATLTLALVLHGETTNPYATSRAATAGPDLVANLSPTFSESGSITANADPADLATLERAPGVTALSGPFPLTFALIKTGGITTTAMVEGRDLAPATVDQPVSTAGTWIQPGAAVIERSFADALGVRVGESITLNGRPYRVAGIAVDAAVPAYPHVCGTGCVPIFRPSISAEPVAQDPPGLIWVPRSDVTSLATPDVGISEVLNVKLANSAAAPAVAAADTHTPNSGSTLTVTSWQDVSTDDAKVVHGPHTVLLVGSGLLTALALASVAVLVGGRLSEQTRRVGLLKAVGATPNTVAAILLLEHLAVTLIGAGAGLAIGRAVAPLLTSPGAGLLGTPGAPPVTMATVALVVGVACATAVLATFVPALQAARTSTIDALADAARPPKRNRLLIGASTRLPIPLLLGVRLAARRPRRLALSTLSVAVSVAGIVAILLEHVRLRSSSTIANPQSHRLSQAMLLITVMLVVLAVINALLITWATVLDGQKTSALARALGATPGQVSAGFVAAQLLSVLPGSVLGVPLGIALLQVVAKSSDAYKHTPVGSLLLVILGTWLIMSALTAVPARIGSRRPAAQALQDAPT